MNDFLVTDQHQHSKYIYIVICEISCWLSVPSDCLHSVRCLFQHSVKHAQDACTVFGVCFSTVLNMHRMPVQCLVFASVQLNMHRMSVLCLVFQYNVKHAQDACTVSGAGLSTVLNIHRMPIWCLVFVSVQC